MPQFLLTTFFLLLASLSSKAQSGKAIIAELHAINKTVVSKSCNAGNAAAISNRAMNVFLADKTSYLSQNSDLSLYTNYVTLNTVEGQLTVNHNFQKATGVDEPIKKLFSVGISLNVANEIAAAFLDKKMENDLGIMLSYKRLGKVKTHFADCVPTGPGSHQKQSMNALRAGMVQSLTAEIIKKEAEFKMGIEAIDTADIPGQNRDTAKAIMLSHFYATLKEEYAEKFAKQQAAILTKTKNYKSISSSWTSITSYIPVISPTYWVASSFTMPFQQRHSYPLNLMLSHTRLWESTKTGRWFLTLSSHAFVNNSKLSHFLNRVDFTEYISLGGADTFHLSELRNSKAYLGQYKTFITPSVKGRLVYFPPGNSHVGISLALEQNFGKYHLLHGKFGIPVILINRKKVPAINIEFYAMFFDIANRIKSEAKQGNDNTVGVNLGIPFSRLMF